MAAAKSSNEAPTLPAVSMEMTEEERGLFADDAEPAGQVAAGSKAEPASRRTKLMPWDNVAAVLLDPFGTSMIHNITTDALYAATANGNKKAAYHSHLCAPLDSDPWHVGAGVSITAQTLLEAFDRLETKAVVGILDKTLYAKAMAKANKLRPHLQNLYFGKGSATANPAQTSFAALKKRKFQEMQDAGSRPTSTASEAQILASARELHTWLSTEKCPLRGLLATLAQGGAFYAAQCAEKTARAIAAHKPLSAEDLGNAALARAKSATHVSIRGPSDEGDLAPTPPDAVAAGKAGAKGAEKGGKAGQ